MDSFYFTGIDCIRLLEKLTLTTYTLEQKNRIRRNLEGFHPLTVTSNRDGNDDIFQLIMDLMRPRPKNFDRGIKIFPWEVLHVAVIKIMTKYGNVAIPPELHIFIKEETRLVREKLPRQVLQLHSVDSGGRLIKSSSQDLLPSGDLSPTGKTRALPQPQQAKQSTKSLPPPLALSLQSPTAFSPFSPPLPPPPHPASSFPPSSPINFVFPPPPQSTSLLSSAQHPSRLAAMSAGGVTFPSLYVSPAATLPSPPRAVLPTAVSSPTFADPTQDHQRASLTLPSFANFVDFAQEKRGIPSLQVPPATASQHQTPNMFPWMFAANTRPPPSGSGDVS